MAFLMRHDRAHLAITEKDPETLITPEEEEELPQEDQTKMRKASQKWKNRNETAYSYLLEVCNAHKRASTIGGLYEGEQAATVVQLIEDRFLNVEDSTVQSEKTKFNTLSILQNESSTEFIDRLERQTKHWEYHQVKRKH
jgi:hypothetical protein